MDKRATPKRGRVTKTVTPRRSARIAARPSVAKIKATLKGIKASITKRGKPRVAAQVEKAVMAAITATKAASATRWVRGSPAKPGRRGRLSSMHVTPNQAHKRKFGVIGDAPAAKKSKTETGSISRPAGVNAAVAAAVASADAQLPPATVAKVEAVIDAALVYKKKVEYKNSLEVRLSHIDEHGLGLYAMSDISKDSKICDYGGLIKEGKVPEDASYTMVPSEHMDYYIDPTSEEDCIGRYAYPCEHIPENVCNAKIVVDDDAMQAHLVSSKFILAGSEIFLQWPRTGAPRFSERMKEKIDDLAEIEDIFIEELKKWTPSDRLYLPVDYVENLIHHLIRYTKNPLTPHMHINEKVLTIMASNDKLKGDDRYTNVYDRLVANPREGRPDQLPRRDGGTVIIIGGPGHFAVWKFLYKGNNVWDSSVVDSLNRGMKSIVHALNLFREDAKRYGMIINAPNIVNLGWQGKEKWSNNACGAYAAYVAYRFMISEVGFMVFDKTDYVPVESIIISLMTKASRIMAKILNDFYKQSGISRETEKKKLKMFS